MRSTGLFAQLFSTMVPLSSSIAADDITPSLDVNSKAVLFSIGGLSNLGADAFNGGFGVKYFIAQSLALRGSLQFITASQSNPANPPAGTV